MGADGIVQPAFYGFDLKSLERYVGDMKMIFLAMYKRQKENVKGKKVAGSPVDDAPTEESAQCWSLYQTRSRYSLSSRFPASLLPQAEEYLKNYLVSLQDA